MPILKIPIFFHTGYFKILKSQDLHAKYRNFEIWHAIIKLKDLTGRTIESWIFCMSKYSKFKTWFCMQNIWIPRCNMLNIKISDLTCRISKYQALALTMETSSFNCSNSEIWHDEYWNFFSRISVNILQKTFSLLAEVVSHDEPKRGIFASSWETSADREKIFCI